MRINSSHPIGAIAFLRKVPDSFVLQFSRYLYRPQSISDQRVTVHVRLEDVSARWVEAQILSLPDGWELALDSLVVSASGKRSHIPMVDFLATAERVRSMPVRSALLTDSVLRDARYFDSGRGLHAYGQCLLSDEEWIRFMGRLLLLNEPGVAAAVDTRWVGHRLMSGFGSLRWSWRTPAYAGLPHEIGLI